MASFSFTIANDRVFPSGVVFTNSSQNAAYTTWDFGDGTSDINEDHSSANTFTHTYNSPGNYTVSLTVTDNAGNKSVLTEKVAFSSSTVITNINTLSALPNSIIVIGGINFAAGITNNTVTFNGVAASINSATGTQISVNVPANATSGKLILTTNGVAITYPTDFTVTSAKLSGTYSGIDVQHINNAGIFNVVNGSVIVGTKKDSVCINYAYHTGDGNQYFLQSASYTQAISPQTQLWGVVYRNPSDAYVVGSNDYKIYLTDGTLAGTTVFAGSGIQGYADGQGTAAQFMAPKGMTADATGNLYVVDANRIRKITTSGVVTTLAGSGTDGNTDGQGTAASFGSLYDITIDISGNLYVTDTKYHNVRKITPTGTVSTFAGSTAQGFTDGPGNTAQFYSPKGITADLLGNIYVSDSNYTNSSTPFTAAIREISPAGIVATILSNSKGDQLNNPGSLTYENNVLYICNTNAAGAPQPVIQAGFIAK